MTFARAIVLWLPPICIAACMIEVFWAPIKSGPLSYNFFWSLVGNVIFLNVIHFIMTPLILLQNPEINSYFRKQISTDRSVFFAFFLIFIFITIDISGYMNRTTFFVILGVFSYFHGWAQFNGIYNFAFGTKKSIFLTAIQTLAIPLTILPMILEQYSFISLYNSGNYIYYFCLLIPFSIAIFGQFLINRSFTEALYLSRYLSLSLIPLSLIANIIQPLVHGMEYLIVYNQFFKKDPKKYLFSVVPLIFFLVMFLFFILPELSNQNIISENTLVKICFHFLTFTTLTHYYLDRRLFRMRDPELKNIILNEMSDVRFLTYNSRLKESQN
jgi:hypothetical protein